MANMTVVNTTGTGGGAAQAAVTTTYKSQITINNSSTTSNTANFSSTLSALRRGKLYDILVGTNGTPADNYMEWDIVRISGGTGSASLGSLSSISTSLYVDPADVGGGTPQTLGINSSAEGIITALAEVFYVGVNQRASYRWVAAPGSEIVWPANTSATGNNGLAGRTRSGGYTGTATMQWLFTES